MPARHNRIGLGRTDVSLGRKTREHFLSGMKGGEWTGWDAYFVDGTWVVKESENAGGAPSKNETGRRSVSGKSSGESPRRVRRR